MGPGHRDSQVWLGKGRPNRMLRMNELLAFPLDESAAIAALRKAARDSVEAQAALGVALAEAGCSYEAAMNLRPTRMRWKGTPGESAARQALDAQAWWNRSWRPFAQAMQAGRRDEAMGDLGDRAGLFWDFPPLLTHLAHTAKAGGQLDLARHLYVRIRDLADRGLPKMEMRAFDYVSRAGLIDVLIMQGEIATALDAYRELRPNPGNAMAHEIQGARLLALAGEEDGAMVAIADMLVTATKKRDGYSTEIRLDFIENAAELAPLRERSDWELMRADPAGYSRRQA